MDKLSLKENCRRCLLKRPGSYQRSKEVASLKCFMMLIFLLYVAILMPANVSGSKILNEGNGKYKNSHEEGKSIPSKP